MTNKRFDLVRRQNKLGARLVCLLGGESRDRDTSTSRKILGCGHSRLNRSNVGLRENPKEHPLMTTRSFTVARAADIGRSNSPCFTWRACVLLSPMRTGVSSPSTHARAGLACRRRDAGRDCGDVPYSDPISRTGCFWTDRTVGPATAAIGARSGSHRNGSGESPPPRAASMSPMTRSLPPASSPFSLRRPLSF